MTDQDEKSELLHPLYKPATSDSVLIIRFVGNTAVVGSLGFSGSPGVDPYQMLAAGEELKRKGFQMIQSAEVAEAKARLEAAKSGIAITDRLPPGRFKGAEGLKG